MSVCGMSKMRGDHLPFHTALFSSSGSSLHAQTAIAGTLRVVSSSYSHLPPGQHQRGRALHIMNVKRGFRLAEWIYPHSAVGGGQSVGAAHACTHVHTCRRA